MTRKYSSISVEQLLDAPMGSGDTTLTLASSAAVTALLGGVTLAGGNVDQFTIVVDPDTASEEIIFVRGTSGNTLTGLLRGQAGTSAITHTAGATVRHVLTSSDLDYYTSGVDNAITSAGTATLSNKTLTSPVLTLSVNAQTGTTYTFVASDAASLVTASNSSAQTYTIPPNSSVAYATGSQISIIQIGTGQVTIQGGVGVTIASTGVTSTAPKLRARYSAATLIKVATDTWYVVGDIS